MNLAIFSQILLVQNLPNQESTNNFIYTEGIYTHSIHNIAKLKFNQYNREAN